MKNVRPYLVPIAIDKAHVRVVFHYDIPPSLDAYYQEVGRAGRNGQEARALLCYRPEDLGLPRFFASGGQVDAEQVARVGEAIQQADEPLSAKKTRLKNLLFWTHMATTSWVFGTFDTDGEVVLAGASRLTN